jgi:hypothetical protein
MDHKVRVCHILWYLSSFIGAGWLFLLFDRWVEKTEDSVRGMSAGIRFGRALMIATLTLLLGAVHHLAAHWPLFYYAGLMSVLVVVVVALRLSGVTRAAK